MSISRPSDHYEKYVEPCADAARERGGSLAMLSLVGSRAYGTDHAESDWDFRGVWVAGVADMLRVDRKAPGNFTVDAADITLYELSTFAKLAGNANPTVLEVLWSDNISGPVGTKLTEARELFLSKRIEQTYGGYAMSQLKNAQAGTSGSRGVNQYKRTKFKLHTLRLIDAGIHALRTGQILVRVPDPEKLLHNAESMDVDQLGRYVTNAYETMKIMALNSRLPDEPDWDGINALVNDIYLPPRQADRTDHLHATSMFT